MVSLYLYHLGWPKEADAGMTVYGQCWGQIPFFHKSDDLLVIVFKSDDLFTHHHHSHHLRLPSDRFSNILRKFSSKKLDFHQGVTPLDGVTRRLLVTPHATGRRLSLIETNAHRPRTNATRQYKPCEANMHALTIIHLFIHISYTKPSQITVNGLQCKPALWSSVHWQPEG